MPSSPQPQSDAPDAQPGLLLNDTDNASVQRVPALTLMAAMDVQDQLLIVHHDMDRLRTLLADAGDTLMENFNELSTMMFRRQGGKRPSDGPDRRRHRADDAIAPDAQDLSSQTHHSPFRHSDFAESQFGSAHDTDLTPDTEAETRLTDRERAEAVMLRIVTALQFQDMANQLIEHACNRLRSSADRIARDIMREDEDGLEEPAFVEEPPMRPNPVTQDEMDAGSVELF